MFKIINIKLATRISILSIQYYPDLIDKSYKNWVSKTMRRIKTSKKKLVWKIKSKYNVQKS